MRLAACRQDRIAATCCLVAAALAFGSVSPAQTNLEQLTWMAKTGLPRVGGVDHVMADFNKDGDMDVVVVSPNSPPGNVLLENLGQGAFRVVDLLTPWDYYICVATGDVDGDGKLDLVTGGGFANPSNQGSTRLFRGRGNGLFDEATAGNLPLDVEFTQDIALGDVDGDGDLDLVLGQRPWPQVSGPTRLYLNDGKGKFTDVTATAMPADNDDTWSVALGDVDGDRDLDLVLGNANYTVPKVTNRLYLNDGRGRFSDATSGRLSATSDPTFAVVLADLDGDGDLDLAEGNGGQSRLLVNDGRGFFGPPVVSLPQANLWTRSLAAADLDRDGDLDLYLGNHVDQDRIYLNDGRGGFADASGGLPIEGGDATGVSIADLDGDGDLDVFTLIQISDVLWNAGNLRFVSASELMGPALHNYAKGMAVADLDGDGNVDLVTPLTALQLRRGAWLALGQGDGRFRDVTPTHAPPTTAWFSSVAIADVDGDGDRDIAFGGFGQRAGLWLNDGRGRFTDASPNLPATTSPTRKLAFGDVDGDGDQDLVLANDGVQNQLWLNNGSGVFADVSITLPRDTDASQDVVLVDVDGDRDLDVVFANGDMFKSLAQRNTLYLNNGGGGFAASSTLTTVLDISVGVAAGDVDRDGDVDLYFANNGGMMVPAPDELYLNDGAGRFTRAPASSLPPPAFTSDAVLGDLDEDGALDLVTMHFPESATIALGDGRGRFVATPQRGNYIPGSPMPDSATLADGDGDGDLDLFAAGMLAINRHRQMFATSVARAGRPWTLEVWAEPAYGKAQIPALTMVGLAGLDPGPTIPPFGRLRLDPSSAIVLPVVSFWNFHTWSLPIPNEQALLGRTLFAQALVFHGTGLGSARLTNRFGDVVFR